MIETPACPECGRKSTVTVDGDMVEDLSGNAEILEWWYCTNCDHPWRFQDDKLNPAPSPQGT